jgi:hypothetical protein
MHFDQNKSIGALGTMIVAKWYRAGHPRNLLISLDSAETRRWMNLDDDSRRADLLGLSVEGGAAVIDILEAKSGVEDARHVYSIHDSGEIAGKPVDQLVNTGKSVAAIFGQNELKDHILTPPRREILRNHLYRQGLAGHRTPEEKKFWSRILNEVFAGEIKPAIRLNLVLVNLGLSQEPVDETLDAEGAKIRLVHLNEKAVSVHLGGSTQPTKVSLELKSVADETPERAGVEERRKESLASSAEEPAGDLREQIKFTCGKIKAACQDFGIRVIEIDPDNVDIGPSVLRYKIKLAPGEDSARLRKQAENIARQLAATSIPIIGFLPGTHYEYLDLARPDRQIVRIEPALSNVTFRDVNELPIHVGVNPAGQPTRLDLGDDTLPHILVAGGTGSGKTIFLYSVVLSLVSAHSDKTLELVIIDPKQVDFTVFGSLKPLRGNQIITEADQGVEVIREIAEHEMQVRSVTEG